MRIDLFAHFTTQEFRQAYLSSPLSAKGRRLDPIAIRTFVQAQRMTRLIRELLGFARPRPPERSELDVHELAGRTLDLLAPMVGKAGVTVDAEELHPVCVHADASQLQQLYHLNFTFEMDEDLSCAN